MVETAFGGTPFEQSVQDFVIHLFGSKMGVLRRAPMLMHGSLYGNMP